MCDFSGFSKRIPSLEPPKAVCTFPAELMEIYRRVLSTWPLRKEVLFIELIFHTYQSPHIGSKLCFAKGTQLISSSLSVLQSLEVSYRPWRIRHLELPGSLEA